MSTIRSLFERLRKHNLMLPPSKARLGATDAKFLSHSISPAGLRPNAQKVSALINMPMPTDVKQVCALMGGINYCRKFLPDLSKRLRPINSLLRKGVKFAFTPAIEKLVREILVELATPPILVFPNWDAVAAGSRPFHVYCDACIDRFGAAHGQEQEDGSMKPIPYISRTTLDSERHWTRIDLEADKHRLGAQTPPRLPLGNPVPHILRLQGTRKHRQSGTHTPESRGVSSSSPRPVSYTHLTLPTICSV